jgi:predicted AlkP superfamily phosphohydrolase/phosphomutase
MGKKVLVIGLDGASWNILKPLMAHGYMPTLKTEMENGRYGVLVSTEPPITPTAWTSFQTGLPPEIHHVFGFRGFQMKEGRLQSNILVSTNLSAKRIWNILSEHNKRVCILNLPLTYPPFSINGIVVSGFPVPSSDTEFTYPKDFKRELMQVVPDFEVMQSGIGAKQKGMEIEDIVSRWTKLMSQKGKLARYLLNKEPWDVFMIHIQETDLMQHYLWHCIDPTDPQHSEEDFHKVAKFYAAVDKEVSELIKEGRQKGLSVIILSDHGFQRCRYNIKINNWLFNKGYLVLQKDIKRLAISMIKKIFDLPILYKYRSSIKHSRKTENATNQYLSSGINYERSSAFVETNATNVAYIHFFKNSQSLIDKVKGEMKAIAGPDGNAMVKEISRAEGRGDSVYKIVFADGVIATGTVPTRKPYIEIPVPLKQHVGMHHRDGIIVMDNSIDRSDVPRNIFSVPNVIMELQEIPFDSIGNGSRTGRHSNENDASGRTDREKSEIEDQLKSLGYL